MHALTKLEITYTPNNQIVRVTFVYEIGKTRYVGNLGRAHNGSFGGDIEAYRINPINNAVYRETVADNAYKGRKSTVIRAIQHLMKIADTHR